MKWLLFFGRLPVAAGLLLIVLAVVALGAFFPQRPVGADAAAMARWEEAARARYGALFRPLDALGFFRWAASPLLWAALVLSALATVLCILARWRALWRTLGRGTLLIHMAVPLLLLALALSGRGWREELVLSPGAAATLSHRPGLALRCEDVAVDRYPDGSVADYRVEVTVLEDGREVGRGTVRLNAPLVWENWAVFLAGYALREGRPVVALQVVRDPGYALFLVGGGVLMLGVGLSVVRRGE